MKTFDKFMSAVKQQITGGGLYCWECYGENARYYDAIDDESDWQASMIADSVTKEVFEITLTNAYAGNEAYRWIKPSHFGAYMRECRDKNSKWNQAWDDVEYVRMGKNKLLKKISEIWKGETEMNTTTSDFEIISIEELEDGGLNIQYEISKELSHKIINGWLLNAIKTEINRLESQDQAREMADEDGGASLATEETQEGPRVSEAVDWSKSFTYPHER